jgi:hypothetical protein
MLDHDDRDVDGTARAMERIVVRDAGAGAGSRTRHLGFGPDVPAVHVDANHCASARVKPAV